MFENDQNPVRENQNGLLSIKEAAALFRINVSDLMKAACVDGCPYVVVQDNEILIDSDRLRNYIRLDGMPVTRFISIAEAADMFGISERALRKAVKEKGCPYAFRVGRVTKIKRQVLEEYIRENDHI